MLLLNFFLLFSIDFSSSPAKNNEHDILSSFHPILNKLLNTHTHTHTHVYIYIYIYIYIVHTGIFIFGKAIVIEEKAMNLKPAESC